MRYVIMLCIMLQCSIACADTYVDMQKIKMMESSGNPRAYNEYSHARGLYQITPIVLEEWNNFHSREKYELDDLFKSKVNTMIAHWYMNYRIPQMLRYYGKPNTVRNRLISYNAGIDYVVRSLKLPEETIEYIRRYNN